MMFSCFRRKAVPTAILCGCLAAVTVLLFSCATGSKPSLQERLRTMGDDALIGYYQGVDARLRAVGEGVRREGGDTGAEENTVRYQQPYFLGGEGNRLLNQRTAAERELQRRGIPRSRWAAPPD